MALEFVHDDDYVRSHVHNLFKHFLSRHCATEVEAILCEMDTHRHYPVDVHALDLFAHDMVLGDLVVHRPDFVLKAFDDAINDYQLEMLEALEEAGDSIAFSMVVKPFAHARVHSLPRCHELTKPTISCVLTEDVGRLLCLTGTVTRAAAVRMLHSKREVECTKCGKRHRVFADLERRNEMVLPVECGNEQGNRRCTCANFAVVEGSEVCRDYQELRVQEQVQKLGIGSIPRSMTVVLQDDLVDSAKPGDDVMVTGVVVHRWKPVRADTRPDVELILRAVHVKVRNQLVGAGLVTGEATAQFDNYWSQFGTGFNRFTGRDLLLRAVCPDLNGLFILKLALLLTLLGGVTTADGVGQRVRGESHLLLIGDPGTGKSQALKFAASLSPRSVVTTGVGSTSAGLTVTATKDSAGEWSLDAGALVLADGGLCCIDEFETMKEHDRTTIHEAMEQQTLSVAKAGLVCKLRTKTTIIAATNPKGKRLDAGFDLSTNCGIASPLLSRFDVILVLRDECDEARDDAIADFILSRDRRAPGDEEEWQQQTGAVVGPGAEDGGGAARTVRLDGIWDEATLRVYMECARRRSDPILTPEADEVLSGYFERQRQAPRRNAARTTVRLLESLIRLAQAHARLMWRREVLQADAVFAVALIEAGASTGVDGPLSTANRPINVCRSEIPPPEVSPQEAWSTVQRVCQWLGVVIQAGGESGDTDSLSPGGAVQRPSGSQPCYEL